MAMIKDPKKEHQVAYFGIKHLKENQMDYFHHCRHGLYNGFKLLWLGTTSIIHAFVPSIFQYHAAKGVIEIFNDMKRFSHLNKLLIDSAFQTKDKK